MGDKITKRHQFTQPINKVWSAISQGENISQWFLQADFKPEVNYNYTFTHENTKIVGEVLKANPVNELVYTWIVMGTEAVTTVSWMLEENEEGTLLTLEHTGISNYPGESAVAMFSNFDAGWDNCIMGLTQFLAK